MKVAIMQPYFFPYIGYFQLIGSVDLFVIYDNIKYTKKGWINRNRFLRNGADCVFTVPVKKDSDALDVKDRAVAAEFDRRRLVNKLREAYRPAPHFEEGFPIVEKAVMAPCQNLFEYVHGSVVEVCRYLGIGTRIVPSSSLSIDAALKAQDRVLALCKAAGASTTSTQSAVGSSITGRSSARSAWSSNFSRRLSLSTRNSAIRSFPGCRSSM